MLGEPAASRQHRNSTTHKLQISAQNRDAEHLRARNCHRRFTSPKETHRVSSKAVSETCTFHSCTWTNSCTLLCCSARLHFLVVKLTCCSACAECIAITLSSATNLTRLRLTQGDGRGRRAACCCWPEPTGEGGAIKPCGDRRTKPWGRISTEQGRISFVCQWQEQAG